MDSDDDIFDAIRTSGAIDRLAATLRDEARAGCRAAASLLADPGLGGRARTILALSAERGLAALIARPPVDPFAEIAAVSAAERAARERVAAWLEGQLGDRAPASPPAVAPPVGVESAPLPRRVCDVAYLGLRELHGLGQGAIQSSSAAQLFLGFAEPHRDQVIRDAVASRDYARLEIPEYPDDP